MKPTPRLHAGGGALEDFSLRDLQALPEEQLADALGVLETVRAKLLKRFLAPERGLASEDGDRLLTVEEAAGKLAVSTDWLYRHKDLPFRVQVTPSQVRFSSRGIEKWIRFRKG